MTNKIIMIGCIFFIFLLVACGANDSSSDTPNEVDTKESSEQETSDEVSNKEDQQKVAHEEYPMPILPGWEEEEITFETIGGGTIDVWHGEFSFAGEIDDYFDSYQLALTDMGFQVNVTQDDEGMKSLAITKMIDGDEHVGNVLFTDHWVKSSLQHFK